MKRLRFFVLLLMLPLGAIAQGYGDLDQAVSSLARGFGSGEARAIVSGLGDGDKVKLQFPGLIDESGFFGRDQASYMLEKLFSNAQPSNFERKTARKFSKEGQYRIEANWTISRGGQTEVVPLHLILQEKGDRWVLASAQSASK